MGSWGIYVKILLWQGLTKIHGCAVVGSDAAIGTADNDISYAARIRNLGNPISSIDETHDLKTLNFGFA